MEVLPFGRFRCEELAQRRPILGAWFLPVLLDGVPAIAEALYVGVAVLGNDGRDSLRMRQRQAEPNGRTLIENVQGEAIEADDLREAVDDLGQILERVAKPLAIWRIREPKTRKVGRDHVVAIGQSGDQVAKHV